MTFWNFHNHSHHSILDGFQTFEEMVEFAKKNNQKTLHISEHGTLKGYYQFYKMCNENDIQPIIGLEAYWTDDADVKDKDNRKLNHVTLTAMNWNGMKNLFRIAWESAHKFYHKPRVDDKILVEFGDDLIVSSACLAGRIPQAILNDDINKAKRIARKYKNMFGDRFYLELHLNLLTEQKIVNRKLFEIGNELNIPFVIASDSHYTDKKDAKYHKLYMNIQTGNRFEFDRDDFYMKTLDDVYYFLGKHGFNENEIEQILDSHNKLPPRINIKLEEFKNTIPNPYPGQNPIEIIWDKIEKGAKEKGIWGKKEYRERIEYEMKFIESLGFVEYFLIVADIYDFARKEKIAYGLGRGSASSSAVCWCLGITSVDPLKYDLMFHRFISPDRVSYPDIDMDFEDDRRDEIFQYLVSKYGYECAIRIGTVITLKPKQSIRDAGRVLKIPSWAIEKVNSYVIERSGGDERASMCVMDTFNEFEEVKDILAKFPQLKEYAPKLEGRIKTSGKHAAGLLIVDKPIYEYTAVDIVKGDIVTSLDYRDLDKQNLIKFDILGLNTLTRVRKTLEYIGKDLKWLYSQPLDDEKVFDAFSRGDNIGIFQFESKGMTDVCKSVKREKFNMETLVAINALYRPASMRSGVTTDYIKMLNGKKKRKKVHPIYDKITESTYGFPIYQEQAMKIFKEIAGYKDILVDEMRKKIAKSFGVETIEAERDNFIKGAKKYANMDEKTANEIYDILIFFGSYGFNKSHAVSYTLLGYFCQYLKQYYPLEFYLGWLNTETEKHSISELLDDAIKHGIKVLPPKLNKSRAEFTLENGAIRCGLKFVEHIGGKSAQKYDNYIEKHGKITSYSELHKAKVFNSRQIDVLYTIDALDESDEIRDLNTLIQFYPYPVKNVFLKKLEKLIEPYKKKFKIVRYKDIDFDKPKSEKYVIPGMITNITYNKIGDFPWDNIKKWGKGRMYAVLDVEDGENHWRIKMNPDQYDRQKNKIQIGRIAIFRVNKWKNVNTSLGWDAVIWLEKDVEKIEIKKYENLKK